MKTILSPYEVRPMTSKDILQVIEIERQSFPAMWPPTAFKRELQQNQLAHYLVVTEAQRQPAKLTESSTPPDSKVPGLLRFLTNVGQAFSMPKQESLLPPEDRPVLIVGFIGLWFLADEAHVVTVAVRESHRRRGIGELLLITALDLTRHQGQSALSLECRVSNNVAINLYEKYGLKRMGIRPRYYSDNHEDAYIFTSADVQSMTFQEQFRQLKQNYEQRSGNYQL